MASMEVSRLRFGAVVIEWDSAHAFPIALDHERPGCFVTQCVVTYRYGTGDFRMPIAKGFRFDGASVPWFVRMIPGLAKLDWHLLATLPHDWVCEHPELLPRPVGDAIFLSVLLAIAETQFAAGERKKKQYLSGMMYLAVWSWTVYRALCGVGINTSRVPPLETLSAMTYATLRRGEAGNPQPGGVGCFAERNCPHV
jgi:hypothetical protein